jgi:hypothetical protein
MYISEVFIISSKKQNLKLNLLGYKQIYYKGGHLLYQSPRFGDYSFISIKFLLLVKRKLFTFLDFVELLHIICM